MRFITFKSLEGKNFLSFGDKTIQVDLRPGVNAIIGTNLDKEDSKNGAGKSSITELLYYSLYGSTLREISKDHIQNSLSKKRCEVSLTFDVHCNNTTDTYKIVRKLNPTKCLLFKNNEDVTRSTLAKTNDLIQNIIHTSAAVFKNSVIMTVNNALPFMALPKTDKRKFIESVLGLEVFTEMVLKARDDYSIAKRDYEISYNKFEQTQNELSFNKTQLENYELVKKERLEKLNQKQLLYKKDIEELRSKIQTFDIDITTLQSNIDSFQIEQEKLNTFKSDLQIKLNQIQTEINSEKKNIKQLSSNKDKCPTCNRNFSEEHNEHIVKLIEQHNKNITKFQTAETKILKLIEENNLKLSSLNQNISSTIKEKQTAETIVTSNNNIEISLKHIQNNLVDIEKEILFTQKEHNNELKGKVSLLETAVTDLEKKVNELNNQLNILETVKFVISEEGIKSFLVKKILTVLNSRLAFYLKKLEANCLCQFDEFFDEKIIDESSEPKSYFNFSAGERKRIDLACLFAFADIRRLQGDVNFSTVFYDELLDSSLDDKGVSLVLKVLRNRFIENNESCYIITHRGPEVATKAEHTIHVVKQNGISFIKQNE